ncbi:MAG: hypothetical protein NXI24_23690 [bacterium]|nr:hypothetical protein [bacterium]
MYEISRAEKEVVLEDFGDDLVLKQLCVDDRDRIEEFSRFVFDIYREEFFRRFKWRATEEDFQDMLEEELSYCRRGAYFAVEHTPTGQLMGSIRGIAWDAGVHFCFEEITGLRVPELADPEEIQPTQVMHVSQVAIAETLLMSLGYPRGRSRTLLEGLFAHMYEAFIENDIQMIVAETDPLVERRYSQIGARMTPRSEIFADPPPFLIGARVSSARVEAITASTRFPRVAARRTLVA